jgi:hypothetical protein
MERNMDISKIIKVYNGKCGCMCGCIGKYSYNPANKDLGSKDRGYTVHDDECSERSVKILAKKILSNPNVKFESSWAFVEDRKANKNQVIYFVDIASAQAAQAALQNG